VVRAGDVMLEHGAGGGRCSGPGYGFLAVFQDQLVFAAPVTDMT
jgi:hypothetical protein